MSLIKTRKQQRIFRKAVKIILLIEILLALCLAGLFFYRYQNQKEESTTISGNASVTASGNALKRLMSLGKKEEPTPLQINEALSSIEMNQSASLTVNKEVEDISWSSSNESVATVSSDGTVSAIATGNATITAQTEEESASLSLTVTDPLQGKTVIAIGDSMMCGHAIGNGFTWLSKLAATYDMKDYNFGVSRDSVAYSTGTEKEGAPSMVRRAADIVEEISDADLIIISGGTNDRKYDIPLGEISDNGEDTYLGALNNMIDLFQQTYPDAKIVCMTPYIRNNSVNALGLTDAEYAGAMMNLCQQRGIDCFDNYNQSGVNFLDPSYTLWADEGIYLGGEANQHFSPAGYNALVPIYTEYLRKVLSE
jgi:lysophospholipase L1-like esterase